MRTVFVTGSAGQVGTAVSRRLVAAGCSVVAFDLARGDDLRSAAEVTDAMHGCDVVVHAGAIAHDTGGTPDEIIATNVLGTWHVLSAAEQHGIGRVVYLSSAQVFGCAEGEGTPDYLPIDDEHPLRATRPYGMSKRLAEQMCEMWSARTGATTIVLRPVMILDDDTLSQTPRTEAEYEAFVHVDDVAAAVHAAMNAPVDGHHRMVLCGPGQFDASVARHTLGWQPQRSWSDC